MPYVVLTVCVLIILFGIVALANPVGLEGMYGQLGSQAGVNMIAGFRFLFGVALWLSAPVSRFPLTLRVVGVLTIAGGIFALVIGPEGVMEIVDWMLANGPGLQRASGAIAIALAAFLAWAVWPRTRKGPDPI